MKEAITLLDLQQQVRNNLRIDFPDTYWIQAEISECKEHYSGHCYLELVQKKERSDALCAKARATIWANVWAALKPYFEERTGSRLQAGQKILAEVAVDYHELYGFSLTIRDIDPAYTLGEVNLRRQEVIRQLTEDGVFDLNKELEWPALPRRVAVISSPSAAGYEDFMDQLHHNEYGFIFKTVFFPAILQGDQAPASIIGALGQVMASMEEFDVVVVIRGGGATTDLRCFDDYELCFNCAQFPLPLLAGIGHDRDSSVLDLVAHTSVKTPTAAAAYLVGSLSDEAYRLDAASERLRQRTADLLDAHKRKLQVETERLRRTSSEGLHRANLMIQRQQAELASRAHRLLLVNRQGVEMRDTQLKNLASRLLQQQIHLVGMLGDRLNNRTLQLLQQEKHRLGLLESQVGSYSPELMIRRGFSLTLHQGRIVKSVQDLEPGAELQTLLRDGILHSILQKKETTHD